MFNLLQLGYGNAFFETKKSPVPGTELLNKDCFIILFLRFRIGHKIAVCFHHIE